MLLPPLTPSLQQQTLAAYLAMTSQRIHWNGRLVLLRADDRAAPFALATLAAGGAVLWLDAHTATLREANQAGITDFNVTTLSEAVRILKNELRKHLPVSVGVLDSGNTIEREMLERGLQPDALLADTAATASFVQRGAELLRADDTTELLTDHSASWRQRRAADHALLLTVPSMAEPCGAVAGQWLHATARLFPRDLHRCYAAAWVASKGEI